MKSIIKEINHLSFKKNDVLLIKIPYNTSSYNKDLIGTLVRASVPDYVKILVYPDDCDISILSKGGLP